MNPQSYGASEAQIGLQITTPAEPVSTHVKEESNPIHSKTSGSTATQSGNLRDARGSHRRSILEKREKELVEKPPHRIITDMNDAPDEDSSSQEDPLIANRVHKCDTDYPAMQTESSCESKDEYWLEKEIADKAQRKSQGRRAESDETAQAVQSNAKKEHGNAMSHKDVQADIDEGKPRTKYQGLESKLKQTDMVVKSIQKCKKLLSPDAKEFKPFCAIPAQPLPATERKPIPRAPYFLPNDKYDASRSHSTFGMTLCMPNLYMSYMSRTESRPIAQPGYWFDEGNGTIIPGLDCYQPKELETVGLILPVWWLPV